MLSRFSRNETPAESQSAVTRTLVVEGFRTTGSPVRQISLSPTA
jgi:hypothetical protein